MLAAFASSVCALAATPTYVGAAKCAGCHSAEYQEWTAGRHSKMIQPATEQSVKGDFLKGEVTLRGLQYGLREVKGVYYITESYLSGVEQEHKIDYTLGSRRIQHYLTTLPDGRIIVLPPSWDVTRKECFHNLEIVNPEQTNRVLVQVWNKSCYSCHVSQEEKKFDPDRGVYHTTWTDFGTTCERCHGPGSEHIAIYQSAGAQTSGSSAANRENGNETGIVLQTKLSPARNTMVCAQCHSLRDIVSEGYRAGADYNDYFLPILEYGQKIDPDPAYWQDGRPRRFSNDALGFWQSQCFLKGNATCLDCHNNVHNPETSRVGASPASASLNSTNASTSNAAARNAAASNATTSLKSSGDLNTLCVRCHAAIGQSIQAHTHHAAGSAGSTCVECHMPRTVISIKTTIRDHSISIPVPENTARYKIPNACTECHKNRDANWAVKQVDAWYPSSARREKIVERTKAFVDAGAGNRGSIPELLKVLDDPSGGPLMRANAEGHLSRFSDDARVRAALTKSLGDAEPLVRAIAAMRIEPGPNDLNEVVPALLRAMNDPVRSVRVGATLKLVNLGVKPGAQAAYQRALAEVAARFEISQDDPETDFEAGKFYYSTANSVKAMDAFQEASKLAPQMPVRYFVACVLAQEGKLDEARARFQAIPRSDPYYAETQTMLQRLGGK